MSAADARPVRIFDVAKRAGVSHQTVSRVINDAPMVADATRAKVKAAIAELGYRPNRSARTLAGGAVRSVTVFTFDTSLYGTSETLRGIEDAALAAGFTVLVSVLDPEQAYTEGDILGRLSHDGAPAMVIAHNETTVEAMRVLREAQPDTFVATGADPVGHESEADWLATLDDRMVAKRAARYLLSMGHATVHYLAMPGKARREDGWAEALAEAGIEAPEVVRSGWTIGSAAEAAAGFVADPDVTAVMCGNDDLAFGVLHAAHHAGREIPGDLSVVGCDDSPLAAYHIPPLTTIDLDFRGVGRGAFELLRAKLEGGPRPRPAWRSPELLVRETSGPPQRRLSRARSAARGETTPLTPLEGRSMPAREPRLWTIDTPNTSYVVALDDDDRLHGLHWGPRLTREQAASLLSLPGATRRPLTDGRDAVLDFNPASALRYGSIGLQVRFGDGTRDLELAFTDALEAEGELTLVFADAHYALEARVHYRAFPDTDVIERSMALHNNGSEPIEVHRADSATWVVPELEDCRLSQLHGEWGAETQLTRTSLPFGETLIGSRRGMTSHQANPWVALDDGTASESHGRVWAAVLAWSGTWRMTIEKAPTGRVAVSAGFGHDPIAISLEAGERLETPASAGLYTEDGFAGTAAAWHSYALAHVLPHPDEVRPVLYNSWEATEFDISAEGQIALADKAAAMGCELFVMDDGWFGARVNDRAGLGDWTPNPDRFPDGLRPLIKRVHEAGMRFGIWVEPEMVNPDSDLYREHPDWVYHQPNRRRTEIRNQLVLNLARPDVAEWMHRWLDDLLSANEIDFVKWDMNRSFTEAGWPGSDDPDRLWFDHTRNLYRILDRLRADHPRLRIESCSSGGGRADFGILRRTDQVWTSDNTDALDRIEIQEGFAQVYPARVMGAWVTDSPNPYTRREVPLDFRFHVAMAGVLAVGGDLQSWPEADLDRGAELVADYKRVRPTVQLGTRHPLKAGTVTGVQYNRGDRTVVLAWRQARRLGYRDPFLKLAGLEPDARYRDERTGRIHHGAVLATHGLDPDLVPGDYASTMIELIKET